MNAFLRQMAVLGVLTTLAEHLLPEGGLRKAGRMVMGLMMMLTILTAILDIIKLPLPDVDAAVRFQHRAELAALPEAGSYRDAVLQSLERQVQGAAERAAEAAGYPETGVRAELNASGEITALWLMPKGAAVAAFPGEGVQTAMYQDLMQRVAQALSLPESLVHIEAGGGAR